MANWNLQYNLDFDSLKSEKFNVQILGKEFTGAPKNITGGSVPVLHEWQTDDPKAPIKGSSVTFSVINDGSLPLTSFYSVNDDQFKVILSWNGQQLFQGFLVQDDCSEMMVDYTHEISLSANDNLGLLKSLTLDEAEAASTFISAGITAFTSTAPHTLILPVTAGSLVQPGYKIQIIGGSADGIYTAVDVTPTGTTVTITITENIISLSDSQQINIGVVSLLDLKPLSAIIGMCLSLTELQIDTFVYGQLNERSQTVLSSFLDQTLINPQSFASNQQYQDCYTILTNIMGTFEFTLFQSLGAWQIVRWDELRYYENELLAFQYDYNMKPKGFSIIDSPFIAGTGLPTYGETGLINRIQRAYSFDLETFNYKQPDQLLRNYDLSFLGALLRTYKVTIWITSDGVVHYSDPEHGAPPGVTIKTYYTYNEYTAPWWYYENVFPSVAGVNGAAEYFIRVVLDNIQTEILRYMVVKNNHIHSYKVEGSQNDVFSFSFSLKTPDINLDTGSMVLIIKLTNGTTTLYAHSLTSPYGSTYTGWGPALGYVTVLSGNSQADFVNLTADCQPLPFDGLLTFYLQTQSKHSADETWYKDIRLDYTPVINQSTKIIGQTHDSSQPGNNIKNNNNVEIFIDDSPRNSVEGTLFLNEQVGLLQKRTSTWYHPYITGQYERLGNIITFEEMFWHRKPRTIIEGTFHGLINNYTNPYGISIYLTIDPLTNVETVSVSFTSTPSGTDGVAIGYYNGLWNYFSGAPTSPRIITIPGGFYPFIIVFTGVDQLIGVRYHNPKSIFSMLSVMKYSQFVGNNFVSGKLSIDYKNDKFTATEYEIWDDGEKDSDLDNTYKFNYIFSPI